MIKLICPYCGGAFQLDAERSLQKHWICPYCGNKSQMAMHDGTVKLVGMVKSEPDESPDEQTDVTAQPKFPILPLSRTKRPLAEMIAEAKEPGAGTPANENAVNESVSNKEEAKPPETRTESESSEGVRPFKISINKYEQIIRKAIAAAQTNNLHLFNIYSRKALFIRPEDPRMYASQAILREKANSYSNGTWASPLWPFLTPQQKRQLLAQKLYAFNTALKLSDKDEKEDLIEPIAGEIVRQAGEFFTEQAVIRRRKMLFTRKFKGHFRKADIKAGKEWMNSLSMIDKDICPHAYLEIKQAVISQLETRHPRLAKLLRRRLKKLANGN